MDYSLRPNVAVAPCSHLTIPGDSKERSETTHCSGWNGTCTCPLLLCCVPSTTKTPLCCNLLSKIYCYQILNLRVLSFAIHQHIFGVVFSSLNWVRKCMDQNLSVNLSWHLAQWLGQKDTLFHLLGISVSLGFSGTHASQTQWKLLSQNGWPHSY